MACRRALDRCDAYAIAWIAPLPIELAAAEAMLDEQQACPKDFARHQADMNVYTWGRIGQHNIVIAGLPAGAYGTTSAATTASSLLASLPSIRVGFLVGIGGAIARPDEDRDIRLGDIVVSQPDGTTGGVCQYDLYKAKTGNKRKREGFLGRPPTVLLNALASIQAKHERRDSLVPCLIQEMLERNPKMAKRSKRNPGYGYQGSENDRLLKSSCDHVAGPNCDGCDASSEVKRDARETIDPEIHYGIIASGNTIIRDAAARDRMIEDVGEDCICVEMEAAGLMNHFPCLVIRGICDYADSHKNDQWQRYAAATAAAYAKELLAYVPEVEVQQTKTALEVLHSVEQKVDVVQETTVATRATVDSIKTDRHSVKVECWIRPPDSSTNANHARNLRHEGTGAWLLGHPKFQLYKSGASRHIWLHGLAGCGKTVLSTTVLDHLATDGDRRLLSFYFDFSDTTKQTVDSMLRSFAFQLYQSGTGSSALDALLQGHQDGSNQPSTKALKDIVTKMLAAQRVLIILDALDESSTRTELVSWIADIASRPELGDVQLFCTSRPESEFQKGIPGLFGVGNCIALDKVVIDVDIQSYVTAQLKYRPDLRDKSLSEGLLERIQTKVGAGANGMFRWAFCQLETLVRCPHEAAIETALECLPRDLDETYRRMLESIAPERKRDAIRLLQFLVHSDRPIRLAEAIEIIATNIEDKPTRFNAKRRLFTQISVLEYCPGIITVIHAKSDELHLAHFSVKEYLMQIELMALQPASISITKTYLAYLSDISGSDAEIKENFPLAQSAADIWPSFAASAEAAEEVLEACVAFMLNEVTFQRWLRLRYKLSHAGQIAYRGPPIELCLYHACVAGLHRTARQFLEMGADVKQQSGSYIYSLHAALAGGHLETVKLLLEKGAEVNMQEARNWDNALHAASIVGHPATVKLLLERGAVVNTETNSYYSTALRAASAKGNLETAKLLLENGADINAQGLNRGNALEDASVGGHLETVKLLLEKGADVNLPGGYNHSPLCAALQHEHIEIAKLLLEKGADVNLPGGYNNSPLCAAVRLGHIEIVKQLLDKGADVNVQGAGSSTALQDASVSGPVDIIKLLLDKGADVNAQGGDHGNALQGALARGDLGIIKLLLDTGADVNAEAGGFSTPLQAASVGGNLDMIKLLLDKGAQVNAQASAYGTALRAAQSYGRAEVAKLLLENGADGNAWDGDL